VEAHLHLKAVRITFSGLKAALLLTPALSVMAFLTETPLTDNPFRAHLPAIYTRPFLSF
jgi:hypothetical protein